jgi:hypothetical protein
MSLTLYILLYYVIFAYGYHEIFVVFLCHFKWVPKLYLRIGHTLFLYYPASSLPVFSSCVSLSWVAKLSRKMYWCCKRAVIASGWGLDDQWVGVRVLVGARIFTSLRHSDLLWAHPASSPMDTGGMRLGREADHSPATSAEVKMWVYMSTPPYIFMA